MPRFVVDSASLDHIRDRLGLLHGDLLSAPDIVGSYTSAMLGGRVLETELDGFAQEWHHAVGTVAGEIDLMQMRLTQAAAAYRQIEDHTRERARQAKRDSGRGSGVTIIDGRGTDGGVGVGSGTTVIGGAGGPGGATHHHPTQPGSGSGTTVIGGGSGSGGTGGSGGGSGTTVIGGSRQPSGADGRRPGTGFSSPLLAGSDGQPVPGR